MPPFLIFFVAAGLAIGLVALIGGSQDEDELRSEPAWWLEFMAAHPELAR